MKVSPLHAALALACGKANSESERRLVAEFLRDLLEDNPDDFDLALSSLHAMELHILDFVTAARKSGGKD